MYTYKEKRKKRIILLGLELKAWKMESCEELVVEGGKLLILESEKPSHFSQEEEFISIIVGEREMLLLFFSLGNVQVLKTWCFKIFF